MRAGAGGDVHWAKRVLPALVILAAQVQPAALSARVRVLCTAGCYRREARGPAELDCCTTVFTPPAARSVLRTRVQKSKAQPTQNGNIPVQSRYHTSYPRILPYYLRRPAERFFVGKP